MCALCWSMASALDLTVTAPPGEPGPRGALPALARACRLAPPSTRPLTPPASTPKTPAQDKKNQDPAEGGQRIVTALMYLATPEEGGETIFPDAEVQSPPEGLSDCARRGLANKPFKGDMIM